jgi:hypothetical protein
MTESALELEALISKMAFGSVKEGEGGEPSKNSEEQAP